MAQARWAKAVHDTVRDRFDRERYERTPAPAASDDALVTVRIPTFGDVDDLVGRALPSVLNGSHRNVEVIVISDGPQPHARAAVGAVRDARLRYLELPERPVYASGAAAFWRTAGIYAINAGLDAARGDFVAPLDHDDAFTHQHSEHLLDGLRQTGADFIFGDRHGRARGPLVDEGRLDAAAPRARAARLGHVLAGGSPTCGTTRTAG